MDTRLISIDELLVPRVLPQVLPCPRTMVLDALQTVAMDFCSATEAWTEAAMETVCAGEASFHLPLARGVHAVRIKGLWIDGSQMDRTAYWSDGGMIFLRAAPTRCCTVTVNAVLRPSRLGDTKMPETLLEEWGDVLVFGALAKLKAMSGNKIEWADIQGAQTNNQLYIEGTARARGQIFRNRHGGGLLFNGDNNA
jgi:hypothetical protein